MATNEIKLVIKIDGKDANAAIKLTDDNIKELYKSFKYGQTQVNGWETQLSRTLTNARDMIGGLRDVVSVITSTFGSFLAESNSGQEASAKLEQSLKQQKIYSAELVDEIKQYAAERQKATGIDDDATISIAGQFAAMGLQGQALKDAITATQDLSALMDSDLQSWKR